MMFRSFNDLIVMASPAALKDGITLKTGKRHRRDRTLCGRVVVMVGEYNVLDFKVMVAVS